MNTVPLRFALFFALLSASAAACRAGTPGPAPELWPAEGCTVGDVRHADRENWVYARGFGQPGDPAVQEYRVVDDVGPASALQVAMNAAALGNLARVEVQDDKGNWEQVWTGRNEVPAGCADVWFERSLAGTPRIIRAIRLGFVLDRMPMAAGRAGLRMVQ